MKDKAVLFDVQRASFVDGPGLRTVLFFKGCNLYCKWCHNPESQKYSSQILFYKDKCTDCGKCKRVCPYVLKDCKLCGDCASVCPNSARVFCGKAYTQDEVWDIIARDKNYYRTEGGVTFSGGECMLQIDFLEGILRRCKENGIRTAVDTAGNLPWTSFERILPYTDLFLFDVKCFSPELHKKGTGVSNDLILSNLTQLSTCYTGDITVKIPIIGGFNDNVEELQRIADFLRPLRIKSVELLPYHTLGQEKWAAANMQFTQYQIPDSCKMQEYARLFEKQ